MKFDELLRRVVEFRDARNWKQFHTPKDMMLALNLEAGELAEHFLWKNPEEIAAHLRDHRTEVAAELADILYWVLLAAHDFDIDLPAAFEQKMRANEEKYPVEKARGKHTKYDQL